MRIEELTNTNSNENLAEEALKAETMLPKLSEISESPYVSFSKIPETVKNNILDVAKLLYQPDRDRLIATEDHLTGKTFTIQQFAYHADRILHDAKMVPEGIPVAVFYADARKFHGGKENDFINLAANTISSFEGETIFYTNNFYTASLIEQSFPSVKMIIELSPEAITEVKKVGVNLSEYVFVSGFSNDFGKKETTETLRVYHKNQLLDHYGLDLPHNFIHHIVSHIYKNSEIFSDAEGNEIKGNIPMGYWVRILNEALGEAAFKPEKYKKRDGSLNMEKLAQYALLENLDVFNPGSAFNDMIEAFEEFFSAEADHNQKTGNSNAKKVVFALPGNALGGNPFSSPQTQEQLEEEPLDALKYSNMSTFADRLKKNVIGQDRVVDEVARGFKVAASGLHDDDKPIRSMLFLGPTGVGKTELSKTIAQELTEEPMNIIRLDMSEYSKEHDDHKLFGAPAGYVGHEKGGILTTQVMENPNSLILLDEVEKASPKIWDSFLQVLDAGRMTDSHGNVVDFRNTVIVLTSNLGANEKLVSNSGFSAGINTLSYEEEMRRRQKYALDRVKKEFRPEFINRIDDTFVFDVLPDYVLKDITEKEIKALINKVSERSGNKVSLESPDDNVLEKIISISDAKTYGARDIKRTVKKQITYLLAETILDSANKRIKLSLEIDDNNEIIVKSEKAKRQSAVKDKISR